MRRTPLKRKTPLRKKSKKRVVLDKQRRRFVEEQLALRPVCEAGWRIAALRGVSVVPRSGCWGRSIELHEPLTRARAPGPDTILDPANSVAVCRGCHDWIHNNPAASTALGLLKPSWEARNGG